MAECQIIEIEQTLDNRLTSDISGNSNADSTLDASLGLKIEQDISSEPETRDDISSVSDSFLNRKEEENSVNSNTEEDETDNGIKNSSDLASPSHSKSEAIENVEPKTGNIINKVPKNSVMKATNGIKGGKPMFLDNKKRAPPKARGRPSKTKSTVVATYQSQITDNFGIKLRIKKSDLQPKKTRKRTKKSKAYRSDSEDSEYDTSKGKKSKLNQANNNTDAHVEPLEQSVWGSVLPEPVLMQIFKNVISEEGCLPSLVCFTRICRLWNRVALSPSLWHNLELANWTKEPYKNELMLKWLIENRMQACQEVNVANWKVTNIGCVLEILVENCPQLKGINLTGWSGLTSDHLQYLADSYPNLQKVDLSAINSDVTGNKSAVATQALCYMFSVIGNRLTHLLLANNKLASIQTIVGSIAESCFNLQLLDLSNISTVSNNHGSLHIEKLQNACQQLKVLRITNSPIVLANTSLQEQADSPGFPNLEEFSIANTESNSRLLDDEAMGRFLKTSTRLRLLDVRGCARVTESSLVRVPAWDLDHLFLSGSYITRTTGSGLELVAQKWSHSLIELDLAWTNVREPLDNAVLALAEKGKDSKLKILDLCGSSVSLEPVKKILENCPDLKSINLASCRGLPRGIKRLYQDAELNELKKTLSKTE